MAINLSALTKETIKVIVKSDSALAFPDEDYQAYLDGGLDESKLRLKEGDSPTYFLMTTVLKYGLAQKVKNAQTTIKDNAVKLQFSFIDEDVRCSLVGITNPATLPQEQWLKFEKAGDGGASEELIELLIAAGISMELFTAKQAYLSNRSNLKKS
jgi:hypothetical protein